MLKIRIIPTLLTDGVMCIRPKYFEKPGRTLGPMMQYVRNFNSRNIDEIIILNIRARENNFSIDQYTERIREITSELFCPCTIGGNVNTLLDIENLLRYGADKVAINTAATNGDFVKEAVQKFGSQCIVASIDSKRSYRRNPYSKAVTDRVFHFPHIKNATSPLNMQTLEYAQHLEELGVGEILLTSIDRDGSRIGYDKLLINEVTLGVKIPVIANGGCNGFADMADALRVGAHAVAASSLFLFSPLTPANCALYLENHGLPTRCEYK